MKSFARNMFENMSPSHFDRVNSLIHSLRAEKSAEPVKILDLGGGTGEYWKSHPKLKSQLEHGEIQVTILDAQIPQSTNSPSMVFMQGVIPSTLQELNDNDWDLVIAFDLIKHLSKENGFLLLYEMERLASQYAMIFTPNGFVYQAPEPGNRFNAHISSWKPSELRKFGWGNIRGHSGFKLCFGRYGLPRYHFHNQILHNIWISFLLLSQILTRKIPSASFAFSALKKIEQNQQRIILTRLATIEHYE